LLACLLMAGSPTSALAQAGAAQGGGGADAAQEVDPQAAALWTDFNHYVRIARPDQALAAGRALLNQVSQDELLRIVEASEYQDYQSTLQRAANTETLAELADDMATAIQAARIARARDSDRIR